MQAIILRHAPNYWDKSEFTTASRQILLSTKSKEYRNVISELEIAASNKIIVLSIERNQNLHDYGQLLIQEQFKVHLYSGRINFYRVRRYIKIKSQCLKTALNHNLDNRRCGLASLEFRKKLPNKIQSDETILAVAVITNTPERDVVEPDSSADYYIEYIIKVSG